MSEAFALRPDPRLFLGRYRAVRPLGSGGSGSVWLARDEQSSRDVALKVVPREGKTGERARREARAMAKLDHPACPHAYACGRDAENVYIAYDYIPGSTFRQSLRAGRVTDSVAVEVAEQVLDGLAHAHERGIVHRDVKPANVLLADDGDTDEIAVRILDFGLARLADGETLTAVKLARMLGRTRGDDRGAARDIASLPRQVLPAIAAGMYAAGAAALLPFYPDRGALPLGAAAAALTLGAPRLGLAFALAVPI